MCLITVDGEDALITNSTKTHEEPVVTQQIKSMELPCSGYVACMKETELNSEKNDDGSSR